MAKKKQTEKNEKDFVRNTVEVLNYNTIGWYRKTLKNAGLGMKLTRYLWNAKPFRARTLSQLRSAFKNVEQIGENRANKIITALKREAVEVERINKAKGKDTESINGSKKIRNDALNHKHKQLFHDRERHKRKLERRRKEKERKRLVRQIVEVLNSGNIEFYHRILGRDAVRVMKVRKKGKFIADTLSELKFTLEQEKKIDERRADGIITKLKNYIINRNGRKKRKKHKLYIIDENERKKRKKHNQKNDGIPPKKQKVMNDNEENINSGKNIDKVKSLSNNLEKLRNDINLLSIFTTKSIKKNDFGNVEVYELDDITNHNIPVTPTNHNVSTISKPLLNISHASLNVKSENVLKNKVIDNNVNEIFKKDIINHVTNTGDNAENEGEDLEEENEDDDDEDFEEESEEEDDDYDEDFEEESEEEDDDDDDEDFEEESEEEDDDDDEDFEEESEKEEEDMYVVSRIANQCCEEGVTKYLVYWEGYDDPTWEPEEHLSTCQELVDEFLASQKNKKKKKKKHI